MGIVSARYPIANRPTVSGALALGYTRLPIKLAPVGKQKLLLSSVPLSHLQIHNGLNV